MCETVETLGVKEGHIPLAHDPKEYLTAKIFSGYGLSILGRRETF